MAVGFGARLAGALGRGPVKKLLPGPISLFRGEQLTKLTGFTKEQGVSSMIGSYFKGQSLQKGTMGWGVSSARGASSASELASARKTAFGIGGGLLAANTLGIDPFGTVSAGSAVARGGMHVAIGSTMMKMGGKTKLAGMAYLGVGAANLFRSGNNLGPM